MPFMGIRRLYGSAFADRPFARPRAAKDGGRCDAPGAFSTGELNGKPVFISTMTLFTGVPCRTAPAADCDLRLRPELNLQLSGSFRWRTSSADDSRTGAALAASYCRPHPSRSSSVESQA